MESQSQQKATLIGFGAILLWSMLAFLVSFVSNIPPLLLLAMNFYIAFFIGLVVAIVQRINLFEIAKMDFKVWILGVGGLFGYHLLLFIALRNAPILQTSLINYLWPLLIVLFSIFLPKNHGGGRLRYWHVLGALLGLAGSLLIVTSRGDLSFSNNYLFGYLMAFFAAIIWASYSVLSRLFVRISTHSVTLFCLVTAISATFAHLYFEQTIWPQNLSQWLAILALGLGPVGGAFYLWDYGMKHGSIALLGAGAYLTPLFSSFILVFFGISKASNSLFIAAILITLGALIAAKELMFMVNKK